MSKGLQVKLGIFETSVLGSSNQRKVINVLPFAVL